jgi:hypothetical protein
MTANIRYGNGSSFDGDVQISKDSGTFIAPSIAFHRYVIDDLDAEISCENGEKLMVHTGKASCPISMYDERTSIPFRIVSTSCADDQDEGMPFIID